MKNLNIEDYLFEFNKDSDVAFKKKISTCFRANYATAFDKLPKWKQDEYESVDDYIFSWAYEIAYDIWERVFNTLINLDYSRHIDFDMTDKQLNKWWRLHQKYSTDQFIDDNDPGDWHLTTEFEGTKQELKQDLIETANHNYWLMFLFENLPPRCEMEGIWEIFIKYRKECHQFAEIVDGETYDQWYQSNIVKWMDEVKEFENSPEKKYKNLVGELHEGWEEIDGWAMPEEVAAFFPGAECLFGAPIFYLHDGMWWDLNKHCYTEN
jgi:hypothetical protein